MNPNKVKHIDECTFTYWFQKLFSSLFLFLLHADLNVEPEKADDDTDNKFEKILNDAFSHYLRYNQSFNALENMLKIINMASDKYHFPNTRHLIMKHIDSRVRVSYFVLCNSCQIYTQNTANKNAVVKCEECETELKADETNFFVYLSLEDQLKDELHKNKQHIIDFCMEIMKKQRPDWNNADFDCGTEFSKIKKEFGSTIPLPYKLNTDGISVRKSNRKSLWPILLVQNYLPPSVRYWRKNLILAALYYGDGKPDMNELFLPLAKEMKELQVKKIEFSVENVRVELQPFILSCCVDLPAKAALQKFVQYNGYHACSFCHHPGVSIANPNVNKQSFVRYINGQESRLRSHGETLISMSSSAQSPGDGVKALSCMVAFSYFDIINSFDLDYMHNCLLGVGLLLIKLWTNPKNKKKQFYISPSNINELNSRIRSIKPCAFIHRRPRGLGQNISFKANEIRSLILYYLPVCLRGILSQECYQHFMLFSSSIHILLRTSITEGLLNDCETKLSEFVQRFEQYFGGHNMVMNVHLLTHLVQCVRRHGPLWAQSAFSFENFNGLLTNYVVGPTDTLLQVTSKYILSKTVNRNVITTESQAHDDHFLGRATMFELRDPEEILALQEEGIQRPMILALKRYKDNNGIVYTSAMYLKAKKTIDYFVGLKNGKFGIIKYYFKYKQEDYLMLQYYVKSQEIDHIKEVVKEDKCGVVAVKNVVQKYLYLKVHAREYITFEPNPFERE